MKNNNFKELMSYARKYKILTYLSLVLGAISGILALVPFIYIWLIVKEVIEVMPNFADATNMIHNGWMAVIFALLAMIVNFSALMCSHLSAFRIASNMRIKLLKHITKLPIGKIDDIGTGKLRKIVSEATGATETYLAHQLPDMSVAIATPICMIVLLFIFDWKLGLVSLIPTVLGFLAM